MIQNTYKRPIRLIKRRNLIEKFKVNNSYLANDKDIAENEIFVKQFTPNNITIIIQKIK